MSLYDLWGRVVYGVFAVCAVVALVVGEIAAVTDWIPHAAHGRAPSTLGYIALYALFVFMSMSLWSLVGGLAWLVMTDD